MDERQLHRSDIGFGHLRDRERTGIPMPLAFGPIGSLHFFVIRQYIFPGPFFQTCAGPSAKIARECTDSSGTINS